MIPRFKPYLGREEIGALVQYDVEAVARFEGEFAQTFEAQHAIAFPYGRSALWTFFKATGLEGVEIIMPAYTCVVVAHAIILSGNTPRFVDITLYDYNMDLDQVRMAINERTGAIVATHLFGYPLDIDKLTEIVQEAEKHYGHKIWIIQDCAHAFGARWKEQLVCNVGDIALFGLNISKTITSIFGGMLTTNDSALAEKVRKWRDTYFMQPRVSKFIRRLIYLLAVYPAFDEKLYGLVQWLQHATPLLNHLTKAYHLDEKIHFPPDCMDKMLAVEAQVGLKQLGKYLDIVRQKQENARYYSEHLGDIPDWVLPPLVAGATYSHYVVRVPNREGVSQVLLRRGTQLGQLIEYSVPHMAAYNQYDFGQDFPNSYMCSQTTINLPLYAGLNNRQRERIVSSIREEFADKCVSSAIAGRPKQ